MIITGIYIIETKSIIDWREFVIMVDMIDIVIRLKIDYCWYLLKYCEIDLYN